MAKAPSSRREKNVWKSHKSAKKKGGKILDLPKRAPNARICIYLDLLRKRVEKSLSSRRCSKTYISNTVGSQMAKKGLKIKENEPVRKKRWENLSVWRG